MRLGAASERSSGVSCVVYHDTGPGPVRRILSPDYERWRRQWDVETPMEAAVWVYANTTAGPHYVLDGKTGEVSHVCPERLVMWHVGSRGFRRYENPGWWRAGHKWWKDEFPDLQSPLGLPGVWQPLMGAMSVNETSIAVEVILYPELEGGMSRDGMESLLNLHESILSRYEDLVWCTHSEAHPLARTSRGRPTDLPMGTTRKMRDILRGHVSE